MSATEARVAVIIGAMDPVEMARLAAHALVANCQAETCMTVGEILTAMRRSEYPILFLGTRLEDMTTAELLGLLKKQGPTFFATVVVPPMAIMTAVDALRAGASDVQEQPLGLHRFLWCLQNALSLQ